MAHFFNTIVRPANLLIAATIGAGMFSLPYVFHTTGLFITALYLGIFGVLAAVVHLMYADIVMRANAKHKNFADYIKSYLGKRTGVFAGIVMLVTLIFTLTAYLILSVSFLHILIPSASPLTLLFVFWALATAIAFASIEGTATFDTVTASITLAAIIGIFIYWATSGPFIASAFTVFEPSNILLPFGPVLFSFLGFPVIPALVSYTRKESISISSARKAIILGSLIPAFFYLLFIVSIWGLSPVVSMDSVSGLLKTVPFFILLIITFLGFFSLWDSYSSVGRDLGRLLESDFRLSSNTSLVVVAGAPIILFFIGFRNFITVIGIAGGIFFAIWGILIVLAWKKAVAVKIPSVKFSRMHIPNHPNTLSAGVPLFMSTVLLIIFLGGIIYSLFRLVSPF